MLGSGTDAPVLAQQEFATEMMVGGQFTHAGGKVSHCIAERRNLTTIGVPEPDGPWIGLRWLAAVPNPSRSRVTLTLRHPERLTVRVDLFDVSGRLVRGLFTGEVSGSETSWQWDGRDDRGTLTPAGIYFVRAKSPGAGRVQRIVRGGR